MQIVEIRTRWLSLGLSVLLAGSHVIAAQSAGSRAGAFGVLEVVTGHAGSVVFLNNIRHGATGEAGSIVLERLKARSYVVRVRTVGYADWRGAAVVRAGVSRRLTVKQSPITNEAVLHHQNGDALREKGRHSEAVLEYERALESRPVFAEVRVGMTRSLISLRRFEEAERQIRGAVRDYGKPFAEAQTVLANLRRNQGLIEEAIGEYRKALRLAHGVLPEAHIGLGIALNELGDVDGAIKEYRIGIEQNMDTEPILYYLLGNILEKKGLKKQAIEAYGNYLRLDPDGELFSAVESMIEILKQELDER